MGDNMSEEEIKDSRLEIEFSNPVYDIINDAITYTAKKYNYKEYDLVKLVMMIYNEDYKYISNDNDYREQFKLLDNYFKKEYNHSIITFGMLKTIINLKNTDYYDNLMTEIASIEKILRTNNDKSAINLCLISYPIENKKYDDLMYLIEKNISVKYAVAIVYDKIKSLTEAN